MGKIKGWSVVPVNESVNGVNIGEVWDRNGVIPSIIEYKWKNRKSILFIRNYSGKKFELGLYNTHGMYTFGNYEREDLAFDDAVKYMRGHPYG